MSMFLPSYYAGRMTGDDLESYVKLKDIVAGESLSAVTSVNGKPAKKMVVPDEVSKEPKSLTGENVLAGSSFDKEGIEK